VTICEEIAEWVTGLRPGDLPGSVPGRAELQTMSIAAGRAAGEERLAVAGALAEV
jgi:hypothetical protein